MDSELAGDPGSCIILHDSKSALVALRNISQNSPLVVIHLVQVLQAMVRLRRLFFLLLLILCYDPDKERPCRWKLWVSCVSTDAIGGVSSEGFSCLILWILYAWRVWRLVEDILWAFSSRIYRGTYTCKSTIMILLTEVSLSSTVRNYFSNY